MQRIKYTGLLLLWFLPLALLPQSSDLDHAAAKRWHISDVLEDTKTSKLAKDIYLNKNWDLSDDNSAKLLRTVERLPEMHPLEKGFYFIVIAKSFDHAEGSYAEGLGHAGRDYVDNNLPEFLDYFIGEGRLPPVYLQKWAGIVSNELEKVKVDQDPKISTKVQKIYDAKCKTCTGNEKAVLKQFEELVKAYIK